MSVGLLRNVICGMRFSRLRLLQSTGSCIHQQQDKLVALTLQDANSIEQDRRMLKYHHIMSSATTNMCLTTITTQTSVRGYAGTYLSRKRRREAAAAAEAAEAAGEAAGEVKKKEVTEEESDDLTKHMSLDELMDRFDEDMEQEEDVRHEGMVSPEVETEESQRSSRKGLRVGLIGAPNAGKSMLTNCLLGRKITAVSSKVNTTTSQTFGVLTSENIQLTIFDTPGVVDHLHYKSMRQRERVSDAYATAALCDALVFVVDAERQIRKPDPRVERLLMEYKEELENFGGDEGQSSKPTSILALSKVDLIHSEDKANLLEMAKELTDIGSFDNIFMVSSLKRLGTDDLIDYLKSVSIKRKWNMNENDSSHNHETLAMELVKEQIYRRLNGEIPYVLKIVPVSCKFLRDGSLRIEQDLLVNHVKKKKIVVGKRGQAIGQIGCRARMELERHLNLKVHLILNVKVRKE